MGSLKRHASQDEYQTGDAGGDEEQPDEQRMRRMEPVHRGAACPGIEHHGEPHHEQRDRPPFHRARLRLRMARTYGAGMSDAPKQPDDDDSPSAWILALLWGVPAVLVLASVIALILK